jgi:hypothetical protein
MTTIDDAIAKKIAPFVHISCGCLAGVLAPWGQDTDHCFVERCDDCQRYPDDETAAEALARFAGLVAHRRYDDATLNFYRPFVTLRGASDDSDFYVVGPVEHGWFDAEDDDNYEIALPG